MSAPLRSPSSGRALTADTPHSLVGGTERWPVIDGIPYLRTGRVTLVADTLRLLDAGRTDAALTGLLADQDDWWSGPPADPGRVASLVAERDRLTYRAAMDRLGFGRVGDYLAHRWSDPTYLAGLALLEAHWAGADCVFELACGTGAYLRDLSRRGISCCGGDVVFAKLWLARHWIVGPDVELVCFDAASPWPIAGRRYGTVLCHDAFYFLEPKAEIAARLRATTAADGLLAIAHVHNADYANLSAGAAMTASSLAELFPDAIFYDDGELTHALAEARAPRAEAPEVLGDVEAFSLVLGHTQPARALAAGLAMPPVAATLRRNPLYDDDGTLRWPSERYRDEYAARATYPVRSQVPRIASNEAGAEGAARSRELVDLPERW